MELTISEIDGCNCLKLDWGGTQRVVEIKSGYGHTLDISVLNFGYTAEGRVRNFAVRFVRYVSGCAIMLYDKQQYDLLWDRGVNTEVVWEYIPESWVKDGEE